MVEFILQNNPYCRKENKNYQDTNLVQSLIWELSCYALAVQSNHTNSSLNNLNNNPTPSDDTGELGYDRLNGTRKIGPSYTYDEYLKCIGLGPSISSVICKNLSYSGPSYPSSPVSLTLSSFLCSWKYVLWSCDTYENK